MASESRVWSLVRAEYGLCEDPIAASVCGVFNMGAVNHKRHPTRALRTSHGESLHGTLQAIRLPVHLSQAADTARRANCVHRLRSRLCTTWM